MCKGRERERGEGGGGGGAQRQRERGSTKDRPTVRLSYQCRPPGRPLPIPQGENETERGKETKTDTKILAWPRQQQRVGNTHDSPTGPVTKLRNANHVQHVWQHQHAVWVTAKCKVSCGVTAGTGPCISPHGAFCTDKGRI